MSIEKAHAAAVKAAQDALKAAQGMKDHGTGLDQRAVALAVTNIEQGLLWLQRAAQPQQ